MAGEEEKIILEHRALLGKAGLRRVSRASSMVWLADEQRRGRELSQKERDRGKIMMEQS